MKPSFSGAYVNISRVYKSQGRLEEAIDQCRQAIRIHPNYHAARLELGECLSRQGKLDEATTAFRDAVRLAPTFLFAHMSLVVALREHGKLDDAIAACREAMRLTAPHAISRLVAGTLLTKKEKFDEAFLLSREAIRLYEKKFAENPSLFADVRAGNRYNAACAALLTVTLKAKEADKLEDAERARLKHQALAWLRDDLAGRKILAESGKPEQLPQVVQNLVHWQQDPDLATLRDEKQVQQLSSEDQELCRKLWADHAELVKSLQARLPAEKK